LKGKEVDRLLDDFSGLFEGERCLSDITAGRFNGCLAGQGVRWDPAALLPSTSFKCTGAATEALKTAQTGDKTVVLLSDFYRQGDGDDESFMAQMIVSETDLDPVADGIKTSGYSRSVAGLRSSTSTKAMWRKTLVAPVRARCDGASHSRRSRKLAGRSATSGDRRDPTLYRSGHQPRMSRS
jgi:hypothetical protein